MGDIDSPVAGGDGFGVMVGLGTDVGVAGGGTVGRGATVASVPLLQAATANPSSNEASAKGRVGGVRRICSGPGWLRRGIQTIIPRRQA